MSEVPVIERNPAPVITVKIGSLVAPSTYSWTEGEKDGGSA
jgi:hypothetical protein